MTETGRSCHPTVDLLDERGAGRDGPVNVGSSTLILIGANPSPENLSKTAAWSADAASRLTTLRESRGSVLRIEIVSGSSRELSNLQLAFFSEQGVLHCANMGRNAVWLQEPGRLPVRAVHLNAPGAALPAIGTIWLPRSRPGSGTADVRRRVVFMNPASYEKRITTPPDGTSESEPGTEIEGVGGRTPSPAALNAIVARFTALLEFPSKRLDPKVVPLQDTKRDSLIKDYRKILPFDARNDSTFLATLLERKLVLLDDLLAAPDTPTGLEAALQTLRDSVPDTAGPRTQQASTS